MIEIQTHHQYGCNFYCNRGRSSGAMPNLHYHSHYEIFYLLSGERKYVVGDEFFSLQKGDCVVISSDIPHKTGGQGDGLRFLIAFNDAFLNKWLTPTAIPVLMGFFKRKILRPAPKHKEEILLIFNEMETAQKDGNEERLFFSLIRLFFILNDSPTAQNDEKSPIQMLKRIMEYIQENYSTINTLEEVAETLYISKYHICHLFSKYVEISFGNYLTHIRLKTACQLLKATKSTVTEISQQCGFNNSSYFCRVFKNNFGVTPLEYRKLQIK